MNSVSVRSKTPGDRNGGIALKNVARAQQLQDGDMEIQSIIEENLPIKTEPFTTEELNKVLQKISNGKALGKNR